MKRQIFILTFSLLVSGYLFSQKTRLNLDKNVFLKKISNNGWTILDSSKIKAEEMFVLNFKGTDISITYINWIEGMFGAYSKYKLVFKDNIVEISPIDWKIAKGSGKREDLASPLFIYCYLQTNDKIFALFKNEKIEISPKLLDDKEWFDLVKINK